MIKQRKKRRKEGENERKIFSTEESPRLNFGDGKKGKHH